MTKLCWPRHPVRVVVSENPTWPPGGFGLRYDAPATGVAAMADWQKTRYAPPKSWSEIQSDLRREKDPVKEGGTLVLLGVICFFGSFAGLGYLVYSFFRVIARGY